MNLNNEQVIVATLVAGLLAPFIIQIIKGPLAAAGDKALYIAYGVAIILGVILALATGVSLPTPENDPIGFLGKCAAFAGVVNLFAELIYQKWLAGLTPGTRFANSK